MFCKEVQSTKDPFPIFVTEDGKVIDVKALQL